VLNKTADQELLLDEEVEEDILYQKGTSISAQLDDGHDNVDGNAHDSETNNVASATGPGQSGSQQSASSYKDDKDNSITNNPSRSGDSATREALPNVESNLIEDVDDLDDDEASTKVLFVPTTTARTATNWSTSSASTRTSIPPSFNFCSLDCGPGGACLVELTESRPRRRCQCPLGRAGRHCERGESRIFISTAGRRSRGVFLLLSAAFVIRSKLFMLVLRCNKTPVLGNVVPTCFECETKTGVARILVIFQDRPVFSHIIHKVSVRAFH